MKLRTLWITCMMVIGMTLTTYAATWSDTSLPGGLPSGWSIQKLSLSEYPMFGLTHSKDPDFEGVIAIIPPEEIIGSLKGTVDELAKKNSVAQYKRTSKQYGTTVIEIAAIENGLHFYFAEYKGQFYSFCLINRKTKQGDAYQDELLTHIFGSIKQYNERGI